MNISLTSMVAAVMLVVSPRTFSQILFVHPPLDIVHKIIYVDEHNLLYFFFSKHILLTIHIKSWNANGFDRKVLRDTVIPLKIRPSNFENK